MRHLCTDSMQLKGNEFQNKRQDAAVSLDVLSLDELEVLDFFKFKVHESF